MGDRVSELDYQGHDHQDQEDDDNPERGGQKRDHEQSDRRPEVREEPPIEARPVLEELRSLHRRRDEDAHRHGKRVEVHRSWVPPLDEATRKDIEYRRRLLTF